MMDKEFIKDELNNLIGAAKVALAHLERGKLEDLTDDLHELSEIVDRAKGQAGEYEDKELKKHIHLISIGDNSGGRFKVGEVTMNSDSRNIQRVNLDGARKEYCELFMHSKPFLKDVMIVSVSYLGFMTATEYKSDE